MQWRGGGENNHARGDSPPLFLLLLDMAIGIKFGCHGHKPGDTHTVSLRNKKYSSILGQIGTSSLCAVNAGKRPHRVQVKMQLFEQACSLAHGAREACQTLRQMGVVPVFGL
jgi:hypothetical protein